VIARAEDFSRKVGSWSDLATLIERFSYYNGHDWLFRGVTDVGHGLTPKIGREESRKLRMSLAPPSERESVPS
jgi:hypothetical protein